MVTTTKAKRTSTKGLFLFLLALFIAAVIWIVTQLTSERFQVISECKSSDKISVICDLQNPEDIVHVPQTDLLVASQYAGLEPDKQGGLVWINFKTEQHGPLSPIVPTIAKANKLNSAHPKNLIEESKTNNKYLDTASWGDPSCPPLPDNEINPHGIDLFTDESNRERLYVVNHAVRESVEMFELSNNIGEVQLTYRGCVVMPADVHLNDVAGFTTGEFVTTDMGARPGLDTGAVYYWSANSGLTRLADTEGMLPNGITLSPDEQKFYVNYYAESKVRSFDFSTQKLIAEADVSLPDNSTWYQTPNGSVNLIIASQQGDWIESIFCSRLEEGTCPMAYEILSLNPDTLQATSLFSHQGGPPMGGGTVGLVVEDKLFIGSYASEWLSYIDLTLVTK